MNHPPPTHPPTPPRPRPSTHPRLTGLLLTLAGFLSACQHTPSPTLSPDTARLEPLPSSDPSQPPASLGLYNNQPIPLAELLPALLEASGGQVLAEWLLDRELDRRLAERNLALSLADIEAEKRLLLESLDLDPDQAQRLLDQIRQSRGLGPNRFQALLRRNAALRRLVRDQVTVTPADLQQLYQLRYGPRFQARLITVDSLPKAAELVRLARQGQSFIDLAIAHSTDPSRFQGGLLPPISPADPTFPQAVRQALTQLQPGQISDPIALDTGFAILKLERKIEPAEVRFDDVKEQLQRLAELQNQRLLMDQLARQILAGLQPLIFDRQLNTDFLRQKQRLLQP